ncbi:MAG: TonB-dependent receptor [Verrucomicrobia bacterium]|nr:TonB-dependent receptor [Verrucomicrobiota bacterium]
MDEQVIPVPITAGATVIKDVPLTSSIYQLDKFVVSGEREGNAQAITIQRQSTGVKSVVSADALGALAGNPGDLVMRLPGVAGDSVGGDLRYVSIRGMSRDLGTITMDGNRMADAASADATREFQFQQVGSDAVERIEVVKSPTPDMDADSIGGAVNLVTKSAFDRAPGRRLTYSVGSIWRPFSHKDEPGGRRNYSVSYSEVFKNKIGITFNYGMREHTNAFDITGQNHENNDSAAAYTYNFNMTDQRVVRTRWGGNLKLDYKLTEQSRFFVNAVMNKHFEHSNHSVTTWQTNQTVATRDASGNFTGTGGIIPGYTKDMTEWRSVAASMVTTLGQSANKNSEAFHYQAGAVHKFRSLNIDYDGYYSQSETLYPKFGGLAFIARGIGMRIDRSSKHGPNFPDVTQIGGPDITKISSYTENNFNVSNSSGVDEYQGAAINAKKVFTAVVPAYVKVGLRIRSQTRDLTNTPLRYTLVGADGVMGVNPATGINDDNLAQFVNPVYSYRIYPRKYPLLPYAARAYRDKKGSTDDYWGPNPATHLAANPQQWRQNVTADTTDALLGERTFKEKVTAAYVMGSVDLGKVEVMGGFRVEKTKTSGEGAKNDFTAAERARRAAWVGPVTDAEAIRRVRAQYGTRITNRGEYQDLYPGLHFKYKPFDRMVARASYAANIGRPAISSLLPRIDVTHETQIVVVNNPSLRPQNANNFDVSLEYYFEPAGMLTAGVFLKEITDFIFTDNSKYIAAGADNGYDGEYVGYNLRTSANGGFARVKGLELAYQQQFTFLPGWLKSFGVFANYTRLETKGNYGGATVSTTGQVAGFTPETGNLGISYIRNGMSLRVQFNHKGKTLNGFNVNPAAQTWIMARSVVDIKTVFPIRRNLNFYLDVNNILNEAERATVRGNAGRPILHQHQTQQFLFGLNGRF